MLGILFMHSVLPINLYFLVLSISLHSPQFEPSITYIEESHSGTQIPSGIKVYLSPSHPFPHLFPSISRIILSLSESHFSKQESSTPLIAHIL